MPRGEWCGTLGREFMGTSGALVSPAVCVTWSKPWLPSPLSSLLNAQCLLLGVGVKDKYYDACESPAWCLGRGA